MNIPDGKDLKGANFEGACLFKVHLNGAELKRANLQAANLARTDLTRAEHFSLNQFSKAKHFMRQSWTKNPSCH